MPRKSARSYPAAAGGVVSCPGYTDENNIWNNGFACPRWGGHDRRYCCQEDGRHFCCPEPTVRSETEERLTDGGAGGKSHKLLASFNLTTVMLSTNAVLVPTQPTDNEQLSQYIPVIASLCAAIILVFLCSLICCFLCQCCPLHRSRNTKSAAAAGGERGTSAAAPCAACAEQVAPPSDHVGRLHCGCHSCGTPASSLHTQPFLPSLGSLNSSWQTDLEKLSEHPPAYTDAGQLASDRSFSPGLQSSRSGLQGSWSGLPGSRSGLQGVQQDNSMASQHTTRSSSSSAEPSMLCMTTFRPICSPRTTATVLPTLVTPPTVPTAPGVSELWRRDSGVLVEEPDADNWSWVGAGGKIGGKYEPSSGGSVVVPTLPGFIALC